MSYVCLYSIKTIRLKTSESSNLVVQFVIQKMQENNQADHLFNYNEN